MFTQGEFECKQTERISDKTSFFIVITSTKVIKHCYKLVSDFPEANFKSYNI